MALTATAIRNAKPTSKAFKIYDEKGLFVQVTPSGGKWWRFKYRFDEKEKLLSLGTYPEVSLAEAREGRDAARKLLAKTPPIDPSASRQADKQAQRVNASNSFEQVARNWMASHMANKSEGHKQKVLRRFELYVFPWMAKSPSQRLQPPKY